MKTEKQLQLVTFEQAKKLKDLGFDWETETVFCSIECEPEELDLLYFYLDNWNGDYQEPCRDNPLQRAFSAPTVALALKWIRDAKGVLCEITYGIGRYNDVDLYDSYFASFRININDDEDFSVERLKNVFDFDTYELAESALLDEILTILEQNKN